MIQCFTHDSLLLWTVSWGAFAFAAGMFAGWMAYWQSDSRNFEKKE